MIIISVSVFAMAALGVVLFLASGLEQGTALGWIAHHGFERGLFLLLDGQHGVVADLCCRVLLVVCDLQG